MKQSVNPAAMAAIIVVAIAAIGFFGWKMFFSGPASGGPKPAQAVDDRKMREQYQNYNQSRPRMPGNMGGGPGRPTGGQ